MKSRRSIIRAVLFVVRLQKSVASHHAFSTASAAANRSQPHQAKRQNDKNKSPQKLSPRTDRRGSPSCPPFSTSHLLKPSPRLKRCESTNYRHKQHNSAQKLFARHRNSAPTTIFFRSSTPHIEITEGESVTFSTFLNMVQPYALRLERTGSGGKPQLTVHPTMAHHLASRILLQKQPSLDDRRSFFNDSPSRSIADGSVARFIRRQGSVESNDKKQTPLLGEFEQNLKRKIKNTMISVYGALTAIEQDDLESLRLILQQNSVPVNDSLTESSFYNTFTCRVTLLDVALMLNRQNAASLLLLHGAVENEELNVLKRREKVVQDALKEHEKRFRQLSDKSPMSREEEKKVRTMEQHFNSLKQMKTVLEHPEFPNPPSEVKAEVASSSRAIITFNSGGLSVNPCVIIKYKVEWSTWPNFETVAGTLVVNDTRNQSITISGLERGLSYTFRISAGSIWGFGEPCVAFPKNLKISSWEDDANGAAFDRMACMKQMAELYEQVEKHRQSPVWQLVFPGSNEISVKKKKTGLRNLFSASSRFIKNVGRGIYLTSIIYTEDKVLCTVDDCLPIIQIDENIISISNDDVGWLMKLSMGWDQVANLQDSCGGAWSSNAPLRAKILEAVASMHNALGVKDIGRIHYMPLVYSTTTTFLVSIHFVTENQAVQSQGLAMRWMKLAKLIRKKYSNGAMDYLNREVLSMLNFFEASQIPLDRGLYLCYFKLQSSLDTIRVTVPDNLPSVLPYVSIRANPHVTQEEWEWLRLLDSDDAASLRPSAIQYTFHQQLMKASDNLVRDLDLESDIVPTHRVYRLQILELHPDVSIIMLFPRAEDVCQVHASYNAVDEYSTICKGCSSIPIPVFDVLSFSSYQPDFIAPYCRLNVFLEHYIAIIGYEKRQCFREGDERVYSEQLEKMVEFQQRLEDLWKSARWISNYAHIARDKHNNCGVSLAAILSAPPPALPGDDVSDVGYHSDQGSSSKLHESSPNPNAAKVIESETSATPTLDRIHKDAVLIRSKSVVERGELKLAAIDGMFRTDPPPVPPAAVPRLTPRRQQSDASSDNHFIAKSIPTLQQQPRTAGIIRVFAAFDCFLPKNSAIKLSISPATTSKEVIKLVIEQINKLSTMPMDNHQTEKELNEYCLVSVIGARERRLRDEFTPMRLQPPWTRGKLYVRRCDEPTSAILFGNESFV